MEPGLQSKAFQTRGPRPAPATLGLLFLIAGWAVLACAQGSSPSSAVRFGDALWPFTLLVLGGLSASFYGFVRRQAWAVGLLTLTAAFDVGFSAYRGELQLLGVLVALGIVGAAFYARSEWR